MRNIIVLTLLFCSATLWGQTGTEEVIDVPVEVETPIVIPPDALEIPERDENMDAPPPPSPPEPMKEESTSSKEGKWHDFSDLTKKAKEEEEKTNVQVEQESEKTEGKWHDFSEITDEAEAEDSAEKAARRAAAEKRRFKMNTILKQEDFALGIFIEQTTKYSDIDGEDGLLIGGRLSFVFNHRFNFGFAGYGLVSAIKTLPNFNNDQYLVMGYGGLMLEYDTAPSRLLHFTIPVLLGAGGFGVRDSDFDYIDEGDPFWVLEPGLNLDINVASVFKIGIGGSYRFTDDILDNSRSFNGYSANLALKFGWF